MLEIVSRNGKWNDHDWHLLCRDKSEEYIFYAPTLRIALSISKALAESIHSTGGLPESITSRLIRNSKTQVFPLVERPKSAFYLAIGLTNNCTLACDYCHAEADRDTINHELIAKSIDYAFEKAAETPKKTLSVSFAVGGEPTMNWKEFIYTVNRIRELEKAHDGVDKVYLSMTTNCYYGAEKREFVANNFDVLTLSIDGHQEIQDIHRPTRAHKGSYTLVSETCKFFIDSNKVKAGLRGTVSNYSVKKLVDVVEHYFNTFGTGYTVAFEPLIEIGQALEGKLMPPTNEEFAMNFWAARTRGKELGLRVITSAANVDRLVLCNV